MKDTETKSIDYFKGVVDAIIEKLLDGEIYIEEEKDFSYETEELSNGWKVCMKWCIGYEEKNNEPQFAEQELYFFYKSSVSKLIKEITTQLEIIEKLPIPDVLEYDNSDFLYESQRDDKH